MARAQSAARRARNCTRCGGVHFTLEFKWCGACREHGRLAGAMFRLDHKKRKLCIACCEYHERGRVRCDYHLDYDNEIHQRIAAEQRELGLCTVGRCQSALVTEWYCEKHRVAHLGYTKRWQERQGRR